MILFLLGAEAVVVGLWLYGKWHERIASGPPLKLPPPLLFLPPEPPE